MIGELVKFVSSPGVIGLLKVFMDDDGSQDRHFVIATTTNDLSKRKLALRDRFGVIIRMKAPDRETRMRLMVFHLSLFTSIPIFLRCHPFLLQLASFSGTKVTTKLTTPCKQASRQASKQNKKKNHKGQGGAKTKAYISKSCVGTPKYNEC